MDEQWHLDLPPQALSSRCWGGSRTPQIQQSETQQKLMQILLKNIWLWPIAPAWRCASTVASWQKKDASKRDDNWDSLTVKVEMNFSKPHVCQKKNLLHFQKWRVWFALCVFTGIWTRVSPAHGTRLLLHVLPAAVSSHHSKGPPEVHDTKMNLLFDYSNPRSQS